MSRIQFLRQLLVRCPGLVKFINRHSPRFMLRQLRILAEKIKYSSASEVHDLPPIFHYWSCKYVRPLLGSFGYSGLQDFFVQHILRFDGEPEIRLLSIGAGNCELDLELVAQLQALGTSNLRYECLEINPHMLLRARTRAAELGIADLMVFTEKNIDDWKPGEQLRQHVIICRQFLHHVVELEKLMLNLKQAMAPGGLFLVEDMVGRNGHMRWPDALAMVDELWAELPQRYKYHHLHGVTNQRFNNWDCSLTGFEGIRAQDILPLLVEHFQFDTFIAFANIIDVFVDRPYGPNFSIDNAEDLAFIDRVQQIDQSAIEAGRIKPTHIIAALQLEPVTEPRCYRHITPEFAQPNLR